MVFLIIYQLHKITAFPNSELKIKIRRHFCENEKNLMITPDSDNEKFQPAVALSGDNI